MNYIMAKIKMRDLDESMYWTFRKILKDLKKEQKFKRSTLNTKRCSYNYNLNTYQEVFLDFR